MVQLVPTFYDRSRNPSSIRFKHTQHVRYFNLNATFEDSKISMIKKMHAHYWYSKRLPLSELTNTPVSVKIDLYQFVCVIHVQKCVYMSCIGITRYVTGLKVYMYRAGIDIFFFFFLFFQTSISGISYAPLSWLHPNGLLIILNYNYDESN